MDLNGLSLDELKQLRKDIDKALATVEKRRKQEAQAAARAAVEQYGFSLDEILGDKPKGTKSISLPKYADPTNPNNTWTGRGRRPQWVTTHIEAGGSLDDLAI